MSFHNLLTVNNTIAQSTTRRGHMIRTEQVRSQSGHVMRSKVENPHIKIKYESEGCLGEKKL
jgi:hypothetical protein